MRLRSFILFLFLQCATIMPAQELQLFDLMFYESVKTGGIAFVSLSDVYATSEHPDSLPMPEFSNAEIKPPKYLKLESEYRKRFLSGTKISEMDQLFIYDYSRDVLLSFTVKNLPVVSCVSIYGADSGYMIGFEINKQYLSGFDKYFNHILVAIGKESPFVQGRMKSIVWKKIESKDFPSIAMNAEDSSDIVQYAGKVVKGQAFTYKTEGWQYYVQNYSRLSDNPNEVSVKRLLIMEQKSKTILCERVFISGESSSFAPLNEQWTGKLFKNKPPVIFGFEYISFGCPDITFISKSQMGILINCDNRH